MVKAVSRSATRPDHHTEAVWETLTRVPDPEIPVISIVDLGIVRDVEWQDDEPVITVTPTYCGCPATEVIMADIGRALTEAGFARHRVEIRLAPAWTTDWITAEARARLAAFGIAPPGASSVGTAHAIDTSAPALQLAAHARAVALRLDAVQGAVPLRRLPGTVRLLQAALSTH